MNTQHPNYAKAYGVEDLDAQRALLTAATAAVDEALEDLTDEHYVRTLATRFPGEHRRLKAADVGQATQSVLWLPEQYADRYSNPRFLRRWLVALTVVGWKLAQPTRTPMASFAEELALHTIIASAAATCDGHMYPRQAADALVELRDDELEWAPDESAESGALISTPLDFDDWFRPFDAATQVAIHPYTDIEP